MCYSILFFFFWETCAIIYLYFKKVNFKFWCWQTYLSSHFMVSSASLGFHVEWFYKLQGWDLREFWNSILAHHPILIGLDVPLWCRTDSTGLPRTVSKGAKSHDAIRLEGMLVEAIGATMLELHEIWQVEGK